MKLIRPLSKQPLPSNAKKVFSGILFDVYQWEQQLFDGTVTTFEKLKRNDTVGVIAVTREKKIILTKQEQPGMSPFIGTAGGIVDDNEEVFAAAERELLEETGYKSLQWELYRAVQPTTKIDWAIFIFIARNCEKVADIHPDAGEKVAVLEVDFNEFMKMIRNEEFRDSELALHLLRQSPDEQEIFKKKLFVQYYSWLLLQKDHLSRQF